VNLAGSIQRKQIMHYQNGREVKVGDQVVGKEGEQ
jgi:hypothetical protein